MLTDPVPRKKGARARYEKSDRMRTLPLPEDDLFTGPAAEIESALADASRPRVEMACRKFAEAVARFYDVPPARITVLASRPRRVYEDGAVELFGDYDLESGAIRVWMRTAVQKKVTSFGTFFSTLCHELCHHLDVVGFELPETHHTRGFYERTGALYHHARGEPVRKLAWIPMPRGRYRVDWSALRGRAARGAREARPGPRSTPRSPR